MAMDRPVMHASWLGRVRYRPTYELQKSLLEERKVEEIPDTLLLLEHEHVFTLGRRADETHLVANDVLIGSNVAEVEVIETDRGGEATYHGPGQLVAYPIVSIRELKMGPVAYVRILEETIIQLLREYGIQGHRVVGKTGVWIGGEPGSKPPEGENPDGRKIAAIGVRVSGGIAMHGMALNVCTDLSYYSHIVPCGMRDIDMTSMEQECGRELEVENVAKDWATLFADILFFGIEWRQATEFSEIQSASVPISV